MKTKIKCVFYLFILLLISAGNKGNSSLVYSQNPNQFILPAGQWSFVAAPYQGEGYKERNIIVTSVTSDARKGLEINRIGIKNRTGKVIAAVKLRWILFKDDNRNSLITQGETSLIGVPGGVQNDKNKEFEYPITSFAYISRSLQENGVLMGAYRLEVEVIDARFEGEFSILNIKNGNLRKTNYNLLYSEYLQPLSFFSKVSFSSTVAEPGCAKQKCEYFIGGPSQTSGYRCTDSANSEFCQNSESSCTNKLCGTGGELE